MAGTMWWGKTVWSPLPDVNSSWQSGWLDLDGLQRGPGGGNLWAWDQRTYSHEMVSHFWMSPNRMPPANHGSHTFSSNPICEIRGKMRGNTAVGKVWDKPDLDCRLVLEQSAYYGNYRMAHGRTTHTLMDLPEKASQRDLERFTPHPRTYDFPHIQFPIRRTETLHIELTAEIELYLEGQAWLKFFPNFQIRTPQWEIW